MKILFLYNNKSALKLAELLEEKKHEVILWNDKIDIDFLQASKPDKIISYTYRHIIKKDIIDFMPSSILNLHISYLPWNRGANPNFWSFVDNTPKGVTIHEINEKLDQGRILFQKQILFDEEMESFVTSYDKLNEEIIKLFIENSEVLLTGKIQGKIAKGQGTYHSVADFMEFTKGNAVDWNSNIAQYKRSLRREQDGLHTN